MKHSKIMRNPEYKSSHSHFIKILIKPHLQGNQFIWSENVFKVENSLLMQFTLLWLFHIWSILDTSSVKISQLLRL